jgi:elongation factor G
MSDEDRSILGRALTDIAQRDPTIRIEAGAGDGQIVVSGMSESHLESICQRVRQEHKIKVNTGEPTVLYLETFCRQAEAEGKYIRQTGGLGNYGHCKLRVEPKEPGSGYQFIDEIKSGVVPAEYVKSIDEGVQAALEHGILAGYPVVDLKVILYDGSYHEVDSNDMAYKIAASIALKEAARKASPVLLEPVMAAEVPVPEEFIGVIIGDINSRRGRIEGIEPRGASRVIHAIVPLSETLQSSTQVRARYSMHFARYEPVPFHGGPGGDGRGVTAAKPNRPGAGSGFAAAELDAESE